MRPFPIKSLALSEKKEKKKKEWTGKMSESVLAYPQAILKVFCPKSIAEETGSGKALIYRWPCSKSYHLSPYLQLKGIFFQDHQPIATAGTFKVLSLDQKHQNHLGIC